MPIFKNIDQERKIMKSKKLIIAGTGLFAEVAMAYFEKFTSFKVLILSLFTSPNITRFASHRMYAAPNTTPKLANIPTR